eukprot:scaffold102890_cov72-Phaeocystis_antarctica.AAC.3
MILKSSWRRLTSRKRLPIVVVALSPSRAVLTNRRRVSTTRKVNTKGLTLPSTASIYPLAKFSGQGAPCTVSVAVASSSIRNCESALSRPTADSAANHVSTVQWAFFCGRAWAAAASPLSMSEVADETECCFEAHARGATGLNM